MVGMKGLYSEEEIARRGDEIYEMKVRPLLTEKDHDRIVAVDIETGEWELGENVLDAVERLESRVSNPETWCVRVGSRYVYRFAHCNHLGQRQ